MILYMETSHPSVFGPHEHRCQGGVRRRPVLLLLMSGPLAHRSPKAGCLGLNLVIQSPTPAESGRLGWEVGRGWPATMEQLEEDPAFFLCLNTGRSVHSCCCSTKERISAFQNDNLQIFQPSPLRAKASISACHPTITTIKLLNLSASFFTFYY